MKLAVAVLIPVIQGLKLGDVPKASALVKGLTSTAESGEGAPNKAAVKAAVKKATAASMKAKIQGAVANAQAAGVTKVAGMPIAKAEEEASKKPPSAATETGKAAPCEKEKVYDTTPEPEPANAPSLNKILKEVRGPNAKAIPAYNPKQKLELMMAAGTREENNKMAIVADKKSADMVKKEAEIAAKGPHGKVAQEQAAV
jgi:hypothetical protein